MPKKNKVYDLIIIGAGPAGIAASIFAKRYKLKELMIGRNFGGRVNEALRIEDYPSFPSIPGPNLVSKFKENVNYLKIPFLMEDVERITKNKNYFNIFTGKTFYTTKSVLLTTGTEIKKLNIPGESDFLNKGISYYLGTPDLFKNKTVAIIGGGDSGATICLALRSYVKKIYWIYLEQTPIAGPRWMEKLSHIKNIVRINKNSLSKIEGKDKVKNIVLKNSWRRRRKIKVDNVFIQIGSFPSVSLAKSLHVRIDKQNHIIVNSQQNTNISGIFAAGDVSSGSQYLKQIVTACSEGAVAVFGIYRYLLGAKPKSH